MSGTIANRHAGTAWHRNRLITGAEAGKMVRNRRRNKLFLQSFRATRNVPRFMRAPK